MKYTIYNSEGEITARYVVPSISDINISEGESIIEGWFSENEFYIEDGAVVPKPPKPSDLHEWDSVAKSWFNNESEILPELKIKALDVVNSFCSAARSLYVTDVKGQEQVYAMKRDESISYINDPDPQLYNYPLISAEIGITAPDAFQVAQVYLNMNLMYVQALAQLESVRLTAVIAIENATSSSDIDAAVSSLISTLSPLMQ